MEKEIIEKIEETRLGDDLNENPILIYLVKYLNNKGLYDELWGGTKRTRVCIDFIREFYIIDVNGEIVYGIQFDGVCALGKGKSINRTIPPKDMVSFNRNFKLKRIKEKYYE